MKCEKKILVINDDADDGKEKSIKIEKAGNALSAFHRTDRTVSGHLSPAKGHTIDKNITCYTMADD